MLNDLLACPYCGSEQVKLKEETPAAMAGSIIVYAYVECDNCKARGPTKDDWDNEQFREQAIAEWNSRAG